LFRFNAAACFNFASIASTCRSVSSIDPEQSIVSSASRRFS
jgi:hypothetical protein